MSQNFATILNEIRANNNKLNIVVVGNVESGKSVVEDTLCEQLGDKVERQPDERIYRHGRPQLLYIADALVSVLTASRKPQEKSVRIGKQSLDSVYNGYANFEQDLFGLVRPNSHYLKEFYAVAKNLINNPENLIVWVDTDTNNCLERCVLKQDKDCKYSFDQLKCLNRIYNSWLTVNNTVPVIKVSGDDLEALKNTAAELASAIDNVF